jgi:hypothetical protein
VEALHLLEQRGAIAFDPHVHLRAADGPFLAGQGEPLPPRNVLSASERATTMLRKKRPE